MQRIRRNRAALGFIGFVMVVAFSVGQIAYRANANTEKIQLSICSQIGLLEGAKPRSEDPKLLEEYIEILRASVDECPRVEPVD